MGTWVEVNDEGAAIAAGDRFSELRNGITLDDPPPVEWGDDDFGEQMRSQYPSETTVKDIQEAKEEIREHLLSSGSAVRWAVTAVTGQDDEEGAVFTNLTPPDV